MNLNGISNYLRQSIFGASLQTQLTRLNDEGGPDLRFVCHPTVTERTKNLIEQNLEFIKYYGAPCTEEQIPSLAQYYFYLQQYRENPEELNAVIRYGLADSREREHILRKILEVKLAQLSENRIPNLRYILGNSVSRKTKAEVLQMLGKLEQPLLFRTSEVRLLLYNFFNLFQLAGQPEKLDLEFFPKDNSVAEQVRWVLINSAGFEFHLKNPSEITRDDVDTYLKKVMILALSNKYLGYDPAARLGLSILIGNEVQLPVPITFDYQYTTRFFFPASKEGILLCFNDENERAYNASVYRFMDDFINHKYPGFSSTIYTAIFGTITRGNNQSTRTEADVRLQYIKMYLRETAKDGLEELFGDIKNAANDND